MTTSNDSSLTGGGKVSSVFDNFAVPAGLLSLGQYKNNTFNNSDGESKVIPQDLYDKLLQHMQTKQSKSHNKKLTTKKHTTKKHTTKKHSSKKYTQKHSVHK